MQSDFNEGHIIIENKEIDEIKNTLQNHQQGDSIYESNEKELALKFPPKSTRSISKMKECPICRRFMHEKKCIPAL